MSENFTFDMRDSLRPLRLGLALFPMGLVKGVDIFFVRAL